MVKTQEKLDRIARLLAEQTTLSLATTGEDGRPCIAPLFYIVDENLSLYWFSSESCTHSRNLRQRSQAAATIYRAAQNWREIRGVQISGEVSIITDPVVRATITEIYCKRFKFGRVFRLAIRQSILHILKPEFFRYIDNSRGFRFKFELHRPQQE
ncbi:MAG TPA: pyridoxamine 5'-phosphate oxidase family protein [Terracidiphilus sp.]|jgi:uncharacterized protein YhbP (UPF0306 family)